MCLKHFKDRTDMTLNFEVQLFAYSSLFFLFLVAVYKYLTNALRLGLPFAAL
jgi:hypothetical protein